MPETLTGSEPVYSRFAADPDYAELIELFVATLPDKVETLRQTFGRGAFGELQMLAHQLKGAGGGYGFEGLSRVAAALEQACKSGAADAVAAAVGDVTAYLARMQA